MLSFFQKNNASSFKPGKSDLSIPEPYLSYASYIGLFQRHLDEVKAINFLLIPKIEEITTIHYEYISQTPILMNILNKHSNIPKLKETFRIYLQSSFEANIDEKYLQNREKIGKVHFYIGLTPEWYIASHIRIMEFLNYHLQIHLKGNQFQKAFESIQRLFGFDAQIILKTYAEGYAYNMNQNLCDAVDKTADSRNIEHAFKIREQIESIMQETEEVKARLAKSNLTIKDLGEQFTTIINDTNKSIENVEHSKKFVSDALYSIEEISYRYGELMSSWTQMNQELEKIRNVISVIEDIADRTNLLSLNASIEAARAGQEGAGFAVVSTEINKLSTQTAESVQSITQLVKGIGKTVSNINKDTENIKKLIKERVKTGFDAVDSFEDMTKMIRKTCDKIFSFKQSFESAFEEVSNSNQKMLGMLASQQDLRELTIENTRKMFQYAEEINELRKKNLASLSQIPLKAMIRTVKTEHRLWKWWLFSFMFGIANLTEEQIVDHTQCRLGKWYYSIDNPSITNLKSYKDMETPHARLHSLAKEIFWHIKQERTQAAKQGLKELEQLSSEIIGSLERLEKDIETMLV
ncbi:MAG: methyl-accepting chemotaxis protein [Leptospiraceae bacterium]|nr:methyl-accepting chemotaxis protein [Leptospiraceae bacterium]